jgi:hypothetical protein
MLNIELVFLGQYGKTINVKKIEKWKSKLFTIKSKEVLTINSNPIQENGTLAPSFSDTEVLTILGSENIPENTVRIAITNYSLKDNFYIRLVGKKTAVITLKYVKEVLLSNGYTIEMFIIKTLYELSTMYIELNGENLQLSYKIPHIETRQCLFDLNGDKIDVLFNTEKPIICVDCMERLSSRALEKGYIQQLQKELRKIKRPILRRIEEFIRKYTLLSICLSFIVAIITNIISSIIFEIIK